jgi:hypothetical protein
MNKFTLIINFCHDVTTKGLQIMGYGVQRLFQQYFSYNIMVVKFFGGINQSTWRKPLTCPKSMTNFII